jgi:hypothetical protein
MTTIPAHLGVARYFVEKAKRRAVRARATQNVRRAFGSTIALHQAAVYALMWLVEKDQ